MTRFDEAYYRRFYENPRTRVYSPADVETLCAFVCAYCRHIGIRIRRVLDLGCGLGYWRDALAEAAPAARYTGVEVSDYLCETHGWQRGSVVDFRGNGAYDLVICQGVLQYLPNAEAARALDNLARLCRAVLYLEALTREDWDDRVDQERTDGDVHLRGVAWYRRRLAESFLDAGGGVFVRRDAGVVLYALEARG